MCTDSFFILILNLFHLDFATSSFGITLIKMIVSLTGKFAVSTSLAVLYVYTSELFPTEVRNKGLGVSSVATRCGSLLAPFAALLVSAALVYTLYSILRGAFHLC